MGVEVKSCADCKPADIDCQISAECKKQRREERLKRIKEGEDE